MKSKGQGNGDVRKRVDRRKERNLVQQDLLRDFRRSESLQQQIEGLCKQELATDPATKAVERNGEACKSKIASHRGRILIINDDPSVDNAIVQWMTSKGYHYTFVSSDYDAELLLECQDFDAVVHSSEFFIKKIHTFLR